MIATSKFTLISLGEKKEKNETTYKGTIIGKNMPSYFRSGGTTLHIHCIFIIQATKTNKVKKTELSGI